MNNINLINIYKRILSGNCIISKEEKEFINNIASAFINNQQVSITDIIVIIEISNALYNNAFNIQLPLDDEIYDSIIVLCKKMDIKYPVGAPTIKFYNLPNNNLEKHKTESKEVVMVIDNINNYIYHNNIGLNRNPYNHLDFNINNDLDHIKFDKSITANSKYNMCGTLDKCKYVLNTDAKTGGELNSQSVNIFERDFILPHIHDNLINYNDIDIIAELKYDGISVEAEIYGDEIISAVSRGDTGNNESTDLTPIFKGYKFNKASNLSKERFGIKFEAIITLRNINLISQKFGKTYVNPRNAIIGLSGSNESRIFRDYITLVPLESSISNLFNDRLGEIEFLNKFYSKEIEMRYAYIRNNYMTAMYQLKQFYNEADSLRPFMKFWYDGIVVEYNNKQLRNSLGKVHSIPRYSIAIKFPPAKALSIFRGYTYSVGQSGVITPTAHFDPVLLMGATQSKTTAHSYKRVKNLHLAIGDRVIITLKNDVIPYINNAEQMNDTGRIPEKFPTNCPSCGYPLTFTDSSAMCLNFFCEEKCIARLTNNLSKLNIRDFSTESIRALKVKSFKQLMEVNLETAKNILGEVNGEKLINRINFLKNTNYPDYRLVGALGFTSIAIETWKLILSNIPLENFINYKGKDLNRMIDSLTSIKGIGKVTAQSIKNELKFFINDIIYIMENMKIIKSNIMNNNIKPKVRFTGIRDKKLEQLFTDSGYDARSEAGVTKDTSILIIPYIGFNSSKVSKIGPYTKIMTPEQAYSLFKI